MPELPRGTVTFAFTDIEGSTALLKLLGDGYAELLSTHRRLVRAAFEAHGGVEIDTQGDASFYAFVRARDAVAAAAEVQRAHVAQAWPNRLEVRIRVGLHTGEPTLVEEGYLGLDVVRAARLCGVCRGRQVLLSETTRSLVGSTLPPGVVAFPLGERHLKDIDEPEQVFELEIEGVERPLAPDAGTLPTAARASGGLSREWEERFERRVEDYIERTTMGMLDRTVGKLSSSSQKDERRAGVDELAAQADELVKKIRREIRRAWTPPPEGEVE